jgi:hypothetical protein
MIADLMAIAKNRAVAGIRFWERKDGSKVV